MLCVRFSGLGRVAKPHHGLHGILCYVIPIREADSQLVLRMHTPREGSSLQPDYRVCEICRDAARIPEAGIDVELTKWVPFAGCCEIPLKCCNCAFLALVPMHAPVFALTRGSTVIDRGAVHELDALAVPHAEQIRLSMTYVPTDSASLPVPVDSVASLGSGRCYCFSGCF